LVLQRIEGMLFPRNWRNINCGLIVVNAPELQSTYLIHER